MSGKAFVNAFSPEYLRTLRERDEPEVAAGPESRAPLVLRESGGRFALFRHWKSFEAGDEPEATFETLEDALFFLAARGALSRTRLYELEAGEEGGLASGFTVVRWGRSVGRLRTFHPDWVFGANVLASAARSSEDLALIVILAGPLRQEEMGEILARKYLLGQEMPPERREDEETWPG